MAISSSNPASVSETRVTTSSRRHALALALGAGSLLRGLLSAGGTAAPLRFAISETVVGDVNLNDARAAMRIWIKRMAQELDIAIDPKLFSTTQEIVDRVRSGQLDAVALNIIEYRQIAHLLDSSQVVTSSGADGLNQYLILVKQNGGIRQLGDLKGRRLCVLKNSRMCVAPAWLSTILGDGHYGSAEQFFATLVTEAKFSRVVLPVFFGQAEACLTSKLGFDTMCELNPQVARDLKVLVSSPSMVVSFYMFRKNYQDVNRGKLIKALSSLRASPSGGQLATLFQFDALTVRDASCLTSALNVLDAADRASGRRAQRSVKDMT
jgi:ABC-type phosphate/phosphonate transport system substrate-binding protein